MADLPRRWVRQRHAESAASPALSFSRVTRVISLQTDRPSAGDSIPRARNNKGPARASGSTRELAAGLPGRNPLSRRTPEESIGAQGAAPKAHTAAQFLPGWDGEAPRGNPGHSTWFHFRGVCVTTQRNRPSGSPQDVVEGAVAGGAVPEDVSVSLVPLPLPHPRTTRRITVFTGTRSAKLR